MQRWGSAHKHLLLVYYFKVFIGMAGIQQISCGKFCSLCWNVTTHMSTTISLSLTHETAPQKHYMMNLCCVLTDKVEINSLCCCCGCACCSFVLLQYLQSVFCVVRAHESSVYGLAVVTPEHQILPAKKTKELCAQSAAG